MYFVYNGVTIGGSSFFNGTVCINKPTYTATRHTLSITIQFLLTASSESNWWSTYEGYLLSTSGLVAPGKKLVIYNGSTTVTFDPDPSSGDPKGVVLNPELSIIGAATDNQFGKICQIIFDINLTGVIANGCKDFGFDVEYTPFGQKMVTFYAELPKVLAGGENSAIANLKTNFKTMVEVVLEEVLGGKAKYQMYQYKVDSKDPNVITSGHKLNFISVQVTYKQVFINQETGKQVSAILRDPRIIISPERFIDYRFVTTPLSMQPEEYLRHRIKVEYETEVIITSPTLGGDANEFDLKKTNEVSENFLQQVFQDTCKPRIEEYIQQLNVGNQTVPRLVDADIKYNTNFARITAMLTYDSSPSNLMYFEEQVSIEQILGYVYKYTDGENDTNYVDRPGAQTFITIITAQEYFTPGGISGTFLPSGCELISTKRQYSKGTPRCRDIKDGLPVYETTTMDVQVKEFVKVKKQGENVNIFGTISGFDLTLEDLFPGIGSLFGG